MSKQIKSKATEKKQVDNSSSSTNWMFRIGMIVLTLVIYGQSIDYSFTLDDDLFYVKNETVLKGVKGIPQIFRENSLMGFFKSNNIDDVYRPVTLSSFAIQKELVGVSAKAGHTFNIIAYILAGLALFSFLKRMFSDWSILIPGFITLIWIAHPIHTEVVCSIKSRDEILSCLFGFLALRSLLINREKTGISAYLIPSLWFLLALFTKESSITFMAIVPLVYWFKGEKNFKEIGLRLLPFVVCAGIFLLIRSFIVTGNTDFSRSQAIYNGLNAADNFNELYGTRFSVLLMFLKQSFLPYPLSWDYSYNQIPIVGLTSISSILSIVLHLGLIYLLIRFAIKRDILAFGLAFFFATSIITNNFFMIIGATFAERFMFVPVTGMLIFLFAAIHYFYRNQKDQTKYLNTVKYLSIVLLIAYSGISIARVPDWKSNFDLYQSGVKSAPNSARAHAALGSEYRVRAEQSQNMQEKIQYYDLAKKEYLQAADILPKYVEPYYNLGVIEYTLQDTLKAIDYYKKSLEAVPFYRNSLHNLGVIYLYMNQLDSAYVYLNKVLDNYPNDRDEFINMSYLFQVKKDYAKGLEYAQKGSQIDPKNPAHYRNLAACYYGMGDTLNANLNWKKFLDLGGKP